VRIQEECGQVRGTLETTEGGHAKCFGVGVLEIIEASKGIVDGTEGCSINKVGALRGLLGCSRTCLREPGSGAREEWIWDYRLTSD